MVARLVYRETVPLVELLFKRKLAVSFSMRIPDRFSLSISYFYRAMQTIAHRNSTTNAFIDNFLYREFGQ